MQVIIEKSEYDILVCKGKSFDQLTETNVIGVMNISQVNSLDGSAPKSFYNLEIFGKDEMVTILKNQIDYLEKIYLEMNKEIINKSLKIYELENEISHKKWWQI